MIIFWLLVAMPLLLLEKVQIYLPRQSGYIIDKILGRIPNHKDAIIQRMIHNAANQKYNKKREIKFKSAKKEVAAQLAYSKNIKPYLQYFINITANQRKENGLPE